MEYADYLRDRASECVHLAVQDPWGGATAILIDLAQDYRAWAGGVERAGADGYAPDLEPAQGSGLLGGARQLFWQ